MTQVTQHFCDYTSEKSTANMAENGGARTSESPLHDGDDNSNEDQHNGEETTSRREIREEENMERKKKKISRDFSFPPSDSQTNQDNTNDTEYNLSHRRMTMADSAYGASLYNFETPDVNDSGEQVFANTEEGARRVADWRLGSQISFAERRDRERSSRFPALAETSLRRETFKQHWPKQMLQHLISDLVECGFFYTSEGDRVQCYVCGVRVCKWLPDHNPSEEHARHQPLCPLVQDVQGGDKVKCGTQTVEEMLIHNLAEERFLMVQQACYSAATSASCDKFESLIMQSTLI